MRINNNLNAMTALNQSSKNSALAGTSMGKISSGLRINKAGDDAAGLAISEKMRGQIRGLDQAGKNAQDGVSVIQTAEGAMEEIGNIGQRMRELTVQASSETNSIEDREKISTELKQLHSEIDRIAESTQFNGKNLLANEVEGTAVLKGSGLDTSIGKLDLDKFDKMLGGSLRDKIKGGTIELTQTDVDKFTLEIKDKDGAVIAKAAEATIGGGNLVFTLKDSANAELKEVLTEGAAATDILNTDITIAVGNKDILNGTALTDKDKKVVIDIKGQTDDLDMNLQIGANTGTSESLGVKISNMTTDSLGLTTKDIDDIVNPDLVKGTEAAKAYLDKLDTALAKVNNNRADLGAYQNRLESAQSNLETSSENLTAAESRIRDVDVAKEMMTLSKMNLLTQASQAMMQQAKQQPEGVMQLLR